MSILRPERLVTATHSHVKIIACIENPGVIEKILVHFARKDATAIARIPPNDGCCG
ncbi:MAG: hypothetical protein ACI915_005396 [Gammaproteobacteria bacterium]|jgi:hypothetical protein